MQEQDETYIWTQAQVFGAGEGWQAMAVSTDCPVEIMGDVDGLPFIFMARYLGWTFAIVREGHNPREAITGDDYGVHYREGDYEGTPGLAGLMTAETAWALVDQCIEDYRTIEQNLVDTMSTIPSPPDFEPITYPPPANDTDRYEEAL